MQLPAYLQGRQSRSLVDRALTGMGSVLPPHISIGGNRFTLIDAAGGKKPVETLHLDVCVIDLSDQMAKQYYEFDYEPGSDDPPTCFSDNGITPSPGSSKVQARTCAECPQNARGSATSKLSGKPIKACRDEKRLAVIILGVPDMLFQLKVTPGSFKNWAAYVERCKSQGVDMDVLVTRLSFEADKNGVLTFTPANWIDAPTADIRDKAWAAKATDALVGRGEVALPPPAATQLGVIAADPFTAHAAVAQQPFGTAIPPSAPPAAGTAAPAPGKRTRRTKAEMEAERQGAAAAPASQVAPFRETPHGAPFGIATPAPIPAAVDAALDSFFK
jgi:hypothetical protein